MKTTSKASKKSIEEKHWSKLNTSNFKQLTVKLEVKLHKGQINDCLFIEQKNHSTQQEPINSSSSHLIEQDLHLTNSSPTEPNSKFDLPLVCSVSNDYWLKIYSLEDRSIFRSHNVSNFSLSSVDCVQIDSSNGDQLESVESTDENIISGSQSSSHSEDPFRRTLLFLSSWDNSMYIYDMNYNRCVHTVGNMHEDALSKVRLTNKKPFTRKPNSLIFTSSWDSLIKVWRRPMASNTTK